MTDDGTVTERRLDTVPLSHLRPDPRNPRTHKAAELRKSFGRFGYTNPIMLDERTGLIAAGHGRYELLTAMKAEGVAPPEGVICEYDDEGEEWYVPVVRGWASRDDDEALAYLIADNRQTELAEWAHPELAELLQPISETDRGLAGTGFTPRDLTGLLAAPPEEPHGQTENSYGERADNYRNKQVRSIIFDYPLAEYEYVTRAVPTACKRYGVETTAELFVAMLRRFDAEHPAPEEATA